MTLPALYYVLRDLAGDQVIIVRGRQGHLHAFQNGCWHRGTRLCTETEGRFPERIHCPYHAWTYDLDSRLIGAPHMDEVPHFEKEAYPLQQLSVALWDGHVFVTLVPDPPTLETQLAALPAKFRPWWMHELRTEIICEWHFHPEQTSQILAKGLDAFAVQ